MAGAAMKKPDIDLAVVLGGKDKTPGKGGDMGMHDEPDADDMGGKSDDDGDELPPGFAQSVEEAFDPNAEPDARAKALYRAIKACTESY